MSAAAFALLDWHDARIVTSLADGPLPELRVEAWLFREVESERYDVCFGPIVLELSEGTAAPLAPDVDEAPPRWVVDWSATGEAVAFDQPTRMQEGVGAGTVDLVFNGGGRVRLTFGAARLVLLGPFPKLEDWLGPLSCPVVGEWRR